MRITLILMLSLILNSCTFLNNLNKQSESTKQPASHNQTQPEVHEEQPKVYKLKLVFACDGYCFSPEADKLNFQVDNFLNQYQYKNNMIYFKVVQVLYNREFLIEFFSGGNLYLLKTKKPQDYATNQIVVSKAKFKLAGSYTYITKAKDKSTNTVRIIKTLN